MKRTVIILIILSFVSRISGFLREVFMAWRFGATLQTDIYIAAMTVPVLIVSFITLGLNNSLIPVLARAEKEGKKEEFFNKLLTLVILLAVVMMFVIVILGRPLNNLLVRGFSPDEINQVIYYSRFMAVIALFQIVSYALMGYLQQSNRFFIAATASIPMNFGTIMGAILTPNPNSIAIMAVGTIVGYFLQLLWVLFPFLKSKFKFKMKLDVRDEYFRMLLILIVPVLVTLSVNQINGIIVRAFASNLEEGSISLLNYGLKVTSLFYQTLVVTLSTVLFTKQAKLSSEQDWRGIFQVTRDNISSIMMLIVPIMLGMMFLATEIIQIIFQRGEFTSEDSIKGGMVLLFYSPSLIALSIKELLSKMFFSMQQPRKPMIASVINIGVNTLVSFALYRRFGINGLAAASTVAALSGVFVLFVMARKLFKQEGMRITSISYIKYFIAAGMMVAMLALIKSSSFVSGMGVMTYTILCGILGSVTYFLGLYVLRTKEFMTVLRQLKQRLNRKAI